MHKCVLYECPSKKLIIEIVVEKKQQEIEIKKNIKKSIDKIDEVNNMFFSILYLYSLSLFKWCPKMYIYVYKWKLSEFIDITQKSYTWEIA